MPAYTMGIGDGVVVEEDEDEVEEEVEEEEAEGIVNTEDDGVGSNVAATSPSTRRTDADAILGIADEVRVRGMEMG
jgi:hypothetical protein